MNKALLQLENIIFCMPKSLPAKGPKSIMFLRYIRYIRNNEDLLSTPGSRKIRVDPYICGSTRIFTGRSVFYGSTCIYGSTRIGAFDPLGTL